LARLIRVFRLVLQLLPLQFLSLTRGWPEALGDKNAVPTDPRNRHFSESSIIPSQFFRSWPRRIAIFRK
jgi:hypothetical protein